MSDVFELRQYTLHPGRRDELIELFERELVAPQEACGMRVVAWFRDVDDPDRFVWFRAFADMQRRREALTCFYGGPVWKKHRNAANATMIDSDDVLLLRLADPRRPFRVPASRCVIAVHAFPAQLDAMTVLQTEPAVNDYPALPVRTEHVVVAIEPASPPGTPLQTLTLEPTAFSVRHALRNLVSDPVTAS